MAPARIDCIGGLGFLGHAGWMLGRSRPAPRLPAARPSGPPVGVPSGLRLREAPSENCTRPSQSNDHGDNHHSRQKTSPLTLDTGLLMDAHDSGRYQLKVPRLRTLPLETSIIERYKRRESSVEQSMSRRGDAGGCYDNAVVESFWGKLKTEMVYHEHFNTKAHARAAVFEYIEMFYNRQRLHAALDYLSPQDFENRCVE